MNRDTLLRVLGAALMFGAGYAGSQSAAWGWATAIAVCCVLLAVFWWQRRNK